MTKAWARMKRIALALFRRRKGPRREVTVVINGEETATREDGTYE